MEEEQSYGPGKATIAVIVIVALIIPVLVAAVLIFPPKAAPPTSSSGATSVSILAGAADPKSTNWYGPGTITVVIGVNNTVTWTNNDNGIPHTVTSDPGAPASFDSGSISAGQAFSFTFTTAGTYNYHCSFHPWMKGTIDVKGQSASNATSSSG